MPIGEACVEKLPAESGKEICDGLGRLRPESFCRDAVVEPVLKVL